MSYFSSTGSNNHITGTEDWDGYFASFGFKTFKPKNEEKDDVKKDVVNTDVTDDETVSEVDTVVDTTQAEEQCETVVEEAEKEYVRYEFIISTEQKQDYDFIMSDETAIEQFHKLKHPEVTINDLDKYLVSGVASEYGAERVYNISDINDPVLLWCILVDIVSDDDVLSYEDYSAVRHSGENTEIEVVDVHVDGEENTENVEVEPKKKKAGRPVGSKTKKTTKKVDKKKTTKKATKTAK